MLGQLLMLLTDIVDKNLDFIHFFSYKEYISYIYNGT